MCTIIDDPVWSYNNGIVSCYLRFKKVDLIVQIFFFIEESSAQHRAGAVGPGLFRAAMDGHIAAAFWSRDYVLATWLSTKSACRVEN